MFSTPLEKNRYSKLYENGQKEVKEAFAYIKNKLTASGVKFMIDGSDKGAIFSPSRGEEAKFKDAVKKIQGSMGYGGIRSLVTFEDDFISIDE